jgi:putative transposase
MTCPHCKSTATTARADRTELGYQRFRCRDYKRVFNERTGTLFTRLQYPTDVICLVVLWRFRYKLSLRDLAEMSLQRGLSFTHEAVRDWERRLGSTPQRHPAQAAPRGCGAKLVCGRNIS